MVIGPKYRNWKLAALLHMPLNLLPVLVPLTIKSLHW